MRWRAATAAMLLLLATGVAQAQGRRGGWGGPGGPGGGLGGGPGGWRAGGGGSAYGRYGGGRGPYDFGGPARAFAPGGGGPGEGYAGGRRGQVLPPAYRGAYVADPGRYHLRAAPPGYGWVGDGRDAYLTQRSTGLVLDHVPRAYEPAPAWRRGGPGRGRFPG